MSPLEGGDLSISSLSTRQLREGRASLGFGNQPDEGLKFDFVASCLPVIYPLWVLHFPSCRMGCSEDQNEIYRKDLTHNT